SAHDSHGKAVLTAPREDTEQFVNITESYINLFPWFSWLFRDVENFCVLCVFRGMLRNKGAAPLIQVLPGS
ncbi:MAG TPA: hypothetical protein O0X38_06725, partial [Methanocorpusculum sp.]|nr:hypothetical protein [Methanocorpusculum sp.]